jgi:hypothetical protein
MMGEAGRGAPDSTRRIAACHKRLFLRKSGMRRCHLRMIARIPRTSGQRFARRELVYGAHVANRAQMTCLVFDHSGRHLHFIDGADGGLSMAAKALKERVAKLD